MKWWEKAVIYQIYPKSFADGNGDGIGDIQGICEHLDELKQLGVNTLWLNPIFQSPQVDNGYDISDYYEIDPIFGTMADVETLIEQVHQHDMKIIFDLVLNHTSDRHPWFQEAISNPDSPYRQFYYFQKGKPNNWGSFFGGSVWEPCGNGDYYFHLFDKKMPDLNWKNPKVRQAMLDVARFWAAKGVDGFRLDAFIHIAKADFSLQGQPENQSNVVAEQYFAHLDEVHTYLSEFRQALDEEFPHLFYLGEASSANVQQAKQYILPEHHECDAVVSFRYFEEADCIIDHQLPKRFQPKQWNQQSFIHTMDEWQDEIGSFGYPTLYWNNHDMARVISRFGDEKNPASQKCLATLMYLQKGIPMILYGEELGLPDWMASQVEEIEEDGAEPFYQAAMKKGYDKHYILTMMSHQSRNASRGMFSWNQKVKQWNGGYQREMMPYNAQMLDKDSMWHFYQQLLQLKQEDLFVRGKYERISDKPYTYRRILEGEEAVVYAQLGQDDVVIPLRKNQKVVLSQNIDIEREHIILHPYGSCVLKGEYYE